MNMVKGHLAILETDGPEAVLCALGADDEDEDAFWQKAFRWRRRELVELVYSKACCGSSLRPFVLASRYGTDTDREQERLCSAMR